MPLRHPKPVTWTTGLAWHPDGRRLATACNDRRIHLWDAATAAELTPPWEGHTTNGIYLAFNHAGDRLVSQDWTGQTRLWDAVTGRLLLTGPYLGATLRFSRDDALLGWGRSSSKVCLYRVGPGHELRVIRRPGAGAREQISSPVLDADGRILVADTHGLLSFFDFASGEELTSVRLPPNTRARPCGFQRTLGWVIAWYGGGVWLWPSQPDPKHPDRKRVGPPRRVAMSNQDGAAASFDGRVLAVARGDDGAVVLHLDQAGKEVTLGPQHDVRTVAFSPDGRWVVTGSHWSDPRYKNARIWDAATGKHVHDLPLEVSTLTAFSPNGRWLASYTSGLGCKLWEVGTWRELRDFGMAQFAFSPDSRLLALSDVQDVIRLVEVETSREVARLTFPEPGGYTPICFSPDGARLIATHSDYKALYVWDLRLLRQRLKELDLDWDAPPYPEPAAGKDAQPLRLTVDPGTVGTASP